MNICCVATTVHISSKFEECIGATTHTFAVAKELQRLGNNVFIVSNKWKNDSSFEIVEGVPVHRLARGIVAHSKELKRPVVRPFFQKLRFFSDAWMAIKIAFLIKQNKCDAILERAHSRLVGAMASILTGKPLFIEVIDNYFSKQALKRAKKIFAYTDAFFSSEEKKKLLLVNAGFDPDLFRPLDCKAEFDVCYVGAFKPWDGVEDLVFAIKKTMQKKPGIKALLVGTGDRFEIVKALVEENGLWENISFTGVLPLGDVAMQICKSRVCVAPYNTKKYKKSEFERFGFYFSPLKVIEYIACGKPVVATRLPIIESMVSEKNGALFEEGDCDDLAEKIVETIDRKDFEEIKKFNLELSKKFVWGKTAEKINEEILKQLNMV